MGRRNNKTMLLVTVSFWLLFILYWACSKNAGKLQVSTIVINEVCDNNFSTAPLEEREGVDWIELYNASDEVMDVSGWWLADSKSNDIKSTLPVLQLQPGEYVLLFATGEECVTEEGIFLNFKLSQNEQIYLYDSNDRLIDSVRVPDLVQNTSYARVVDGSINWDQGVPTPTVSNNGTLFVQRKEIENPRFSVESGFYSEGIYLELFTDEDNLDIYYTLDGSEPSVNSMLYIEPIYIENRSYEENVLSARTDISFEENYRYAPDTTVDKITVIRAIAVDEAGNKSNVVTNSYLVDVGADSTYEDMVTVSLVTAPEYLFDVDDGLYVTGSEYEEFASQAGYILDDDYVLPNYWSGGRLTEVPAYIEVFNSDRQAVLQQDVGIRVRGNATRNLPQKSFSVYAREMYSGKDYFTNDVFGQGNKYNKFLLSTDRDITKIRQVLHSRLLQDRAVDTQQFIKCNVFLDGEYWGVYSITEAFNEEYIHNKYGIPEAEVNFCTHLRPIELLRIVGGNEELSEVEIYQKLVDSIDLQSFIDYYASMIYMDNYDWIPHNGYTWASTTISESNPCQDGKWRWVVYDTEWCEKSYERNTFREGIVDTWEIDPLVKALMVSSEFQEQFVVTFMDLANTIFEEEYVLGQIDTIFGTYSQAVEAQGIRWGDDWADEVYQELDAIKQFYCNRFEYVVGYLKEEFGLQGNLVPVTLSMNDVQKGTIKINTVIPQYRGEKWTGMYFADYPITISAVEDEKNSFVGWYNEIGEFISDERELTVFLDDMNYYHAEFK